MSGPHYASDVTPWRKTYLRLDVPEQVITTPFVALQRSGSEIARGGIDPNNSANVQQLASGGFAITPLNDKTSNISERNDNNNAVIRASSWNNSPAVKEVPRNRANTDLPGVVPGPNVAPSGDYFLWSGNHPAGSSYADSTHAADVGAYPKLPSSSQNAPVDRLGVSNVMLPADQPFTIRWEVNGTKSSAPDVVWQKYFGGPTTVYGEGQYGLSFLGSGYVILYEYITYGGASTWISRDAWKYSDPSQVMGQSHSMRIWPHYSPDGKAFIEFRSDSTDTPASADSYIGKGYYPSRTQQNVRIYKVTQFIIPSNPGTNGPIATANRRRNVTGSGVLRWEARQDVKMMLQVAKVVFKTSARLVDNIFSLGNNTLSGTKMLMKVQAIVPAGSKLEQKAMDAATGLELTQSPVAPPPVAGQVPPDKSYIVNPNQPNYYPVFEYTSDGNATPILSSYSIEKQGITTTTPVTEFAGGRLKSISITGAELDPSHETASLTLKDPSNLMTVLKTRASIRAIIETEYDPTDSTKRSVLFSGYLEKANSNRKGTSGGTGFGAGNGTKLFPHPLWSEFTCDLFGMWTRLHEQYTSARKDFANDPAGVPNSDGVIPPWKITDAIRFMLQLGGFALNQIDVPDSPIRFFQGPNDSDQEFSVEPLTNIAEYILDLSRKYLNWALVYDANAGTNGGMWRMRKPPTSPYTNLATFLTTPPSGKHPTRPESYGSTNWVGANISTFIRKGTLNTWVKRPEANAVKVTGTGELLADKTGQLGLMNYAVNQASLTDPTNPDFIGRYVELVDVDTSLNQQAAVDLITRRLYDVTCHATKFATFEAPLVLITDAADSLQTHPRPLRYYDPVLINQNGVTSQWLIRNVNPSWHYDGTMMARYELQAPNF